MKRDRSRNKKMEILCVIYLGLGKMQLWKCTSTHLTRRCIVQTKGRVIQILHNVVTTSVSCLAL